MIKHNSPESITQWLRLTLDTTTPRIDLRSQKRLEQEGKARVWAGDLRGDLSQWLAKAEFQRRPDVPEVLEQTEPGFGTIAGRELFRGLYL